MLRLFSEAPYDFDAFRRGIVEMNRLDRINANMSRLPVLGRLARPVPTWATQAEADRTLRIIDAMTPEERQKPHLIDIPQNRRRVAIDAGVDQADVLRMVSRFDAMAEHLKRLTQMGFADRLRLILRTVREELAALRGKPAR